jgi:hypothetical protein
MSYIVSNEVMICVIGLSAVFGIIIGVGMTLTFIPKRRPYREE